MITMAVYKEKQFVLSSQCGGNSRLDEADPLLSDLCKGQRGQRIITGAWGRKELTAHLVAEQQGGCEVGVSHCPL